MIFWILIALGMLLIILGIGAFFCATALIAWILIILGVILIPAGIGARFCNKK